jgi:hypothetical protein
MAHSNEWSACQLAKSCAAAHTLGMRIENASEVECSLRLDLLLLLLLLLLLCHTGSWQEAQGGGQQG